ncbi:ABC transporter ATP-binding protein [Pseudarthrobacter sp. NamE5]|uniref:ABC transporter ATP-binding protein n=1 Tax=Pseudarthrobacter sp. NamE5 TaxID=2576839 RepID=UPI00110B623E|nr:ABC transporter ATP-binding protein [Pseudarthrobacter sp. NamE5]TLM83510.1 ABC transporter ATP-binding protein [Pseudarthrobacter sp. NamE5]
MRRTSRTRTPAPVMRAPAILRTFGPFLRPQWFGCLLAALLAVAGTGIALLKPWPLKYLFDEVLLPSGNPSSQDVQYILVLVVVALAAIAVLDSLVGAARSYILTVVGERVAAGIRTRLYDHLQRLPLAYHERTPTGELTTRLTGDVDKVRALLTVTFVDASTHVLTLAGMAGVLLVLDWQLSLALLMVLPLLMLTVTSFRARIRAVEENARDSEGDLAAVAQESLVAIKLVKATGREGHESKRFRHHSDASVAAVLRSARTSAAFGAAVDAVVAVATTGLIWLGAQRVLQGALTPGDLVIFTSYLRDFFGPTRALSKLPAQLTRAGVRAARIADTLGRSPDIQDKPDARPAGPPRKQLSLDRVGFAYTQDRPVLRNVDLTVPVGTTLAVVGPTGAGKSTIAALMCRLQDPTSGRVLLDGTDLRDLTVASLHSQVGLVTQDAVLFRATVRENIAYGRPDASFEEIQDAARAAQAHDFVQALPRGYNTVLAERGATLSGGQRQRLALARGVLQGCPILVLDEPTTGLDARAERAVLNALRHVASGRTTVIITHRMTAAMAADEIVVLDAGRVMERGTHQRLIAAGGLYTEMCLLQGITGSRPARNRSARSNGHHHSPPQSKAEADQPITYPRGGRQ